MGAIQLFSQYQVFYLNLKFQTMFDSYIGTDQQPILSTSMILCKAHFYYIFPFKISVE